MELRERKHVKVDRPFSSPATRFSLFQPSPLTYALNREETPVDRSRIPHGRPDKHDCAVSLA